MMRRTGQFIIQIKTASLDFEKKKDGFYLNSLHIYNIRFEGSKHNAEDEVMAADYFEKLKKGDAKTGKDGISYKEVFKEYGSSEEYLYSCR